MSTPPPPRRPAWLRKPLPHGGEAVRDLLADLRLGTVCASARCPNRAECHARGCATFLLMGPHCTRDCGFCSVGHGEPAPLAEDEPARVAEAAKRLGLTHVVVTSVTRDDLPDGGAAHFARTVAAIRDACPGASVEILTPDFWGDEDAWRVAADAKADVFNHNLETVERLYDRVRPGADYDRSLALLDFVKERVPATVTKSGLMLGLGETRDEILETAEDLLGVGVSMITVGQYLCPDRARNLPEAEFVPPEAFAELAEALRAMGFAHVACSPFTRSSHGAAEAFAEAGGRRAGAPPL